MKVNVLGQINIKGDELQVYEFANPQIGEGLYFSHMEVLQYMFMQRIININDIDKVFDVLSPSDLIDIPSVKLPDVRHVFIKDEALGRLIKVDTFDNPNWKDLIHPIVMYL